MPILQNKLVIKSIEALHDEALSLATDTDSNLDATAPMFTSKTNAPPQESQINKSSDTSIDVSPETALDHNIMARIDHLLKKLDEDEGVAIAPPSDKGPKLNIEDQTNDAFDHTPDGNSDGMSNSGRQGEKPQPDQTKALADIAEAIYQAQHQAVDTITADLSQNNSTPFDIDALSATVANEVRRTVSAVMIAELPHLVRDAVGKEIRALPANALSQSKPVIGNPSAAKTVAARKTTATKKSKGKKARNKKTVAKRTSVKSGQKELGIKKIKPKEVGTNATTKITPST